MKENIVVDALIVCDGKNNSFFSYIPIEIAEEMMLDSGLDCESVVLRETDDRPVPQELKDGQTEITDILVKLEANIMFYLN